jgi:hypothetical protein
MFDAAPGTVTAASAAREKVAFYANLFRARSDVYAVRWDSDRTGRGGWMPVVQGGLRKGVRPADHHYLALAEEVVTRHLAGDIEMGLYPLLDNDRCHWLAADFDGDTALLDALAYLKAARANGVTAALEVSRSGVGAHVWVFFTSAVPAAQARRLGTGLLREAMTMAGRLDLASYDRLFPSQDLLPAGGIGNLIAAPLQGRRRRTGTTVFLDLATLEPHEDPWTYLSSLPRVTPAELTRVATRLGAVRTGSGVDKVVTSSATKIDVRCRGQSTWSSGRRPAAAAGHARPARSPARARGEQPGRDGRSPQRRKPSGVPLLRHPDAGAADSAQRRTGP